MIVTQIELSKVAIRQDQPLKAIQIFTDAQKHFKFEPSMLAGIARIYDMLNDPKKSFLLYKQVLNYENNSVEAIA